MEEHCVFCGKSIPGNAVYCQECAPIVEGLEPSKRLYLEKMLADKATRALFCESWKKIKEAMAAAMCCVLQAITFVAEWLTANDDTQVEA